MLWTIRQIAVRFIRNVRPPVRRSVFVRPMVDRLEDRLAPAVIGWDGGAGTRAWGDPTNWVGDVLPASNDDVEIDLPGTAPVTLTGMAVAVRSLAARANVVVGTDGQLAVSGGLELQPGRSLTVESLTGSFTAAGPSTVDGASLYARNGGYLSLPGVGAYSHGGGGTPVIQADGSGSVIDLPGLATLTGPVGDLAGVVVRATAGGRVDASGLVSAAIAAGGSGRNAITFQADGPGSVVDLSALASFRDDTPFTSGESRLVATDGGEVRTPALTSLDGIGVVLSGSGSLIPLDQLTRLTNGRLELAAVARSFPGLTVVDGSSLVATGGATLNLPGVTAYTYTGRFNSVGSLTASGTGSSLGLPALGSITGSLTDLTGVTAHADGGGRIDLHSLHTATIAAGTPARNALRFEADGPGSLIDLTALGTFTDRCVFSIGESALSASAGGEVRVPALTSTDGVTISITGASTLPVSQLVSVVNGGVSIAAADLTIPNLTSVDGSNLSAAAGGRLALPGVSRYQHSGDRTPTLRAVGAGSVLDLSTATTLTGPTRDLAGVAVEATGGGRVVLSGLTTATIPVGPNARNGITFEADGPGSTVDLPALTSLTDGSAFGGSYSALDARNGAAINAPLLTTLDNTSVTISGAGSHIPVAQLTAVTNGAIVITGAGNTRSFDRLVTAVGSSLSVTGGGAVLPSLTRADRAVIRVTGGAFTAPVLAQIPGASFFVSGGAACSLPLVREYDLPDAAFSFGTFEVDGAGSVLDLPALTTVTGSPAGFSGLSVRAVRGGVVRAAALTSVADSPEGDGGNRRFQFVADGSGSRIVVPVLARVTDRSSYFGQSSLEVSNGGEVHAPALTTLDNVGVYLTGPTSVLPTDQFTSITNGAVVVSGGGNARAFPLLARVDGTRLLAENGGRLTVPGVATTTDATLSALSGGVLALPGLTGFTVAAAATMIESVGSGSSLQTPALSAVTVSGGRLTATVPELPLATLTLTGGEVAGTTAFAVSQSLSWAGGVVAPGGDIRLGNGSVNHVSGLGARLVRRLVNAGRLTFDGATFILGSDGDAGVIANAAGGTLTLSGDGDIVPGGGGAGNLVENAGTLVRTGSGDTRIGVRYAGGGAVTVSQGKLDFTAAGTADFGGLSYLSNAPDTTVRLTTSLTGGTTNSGLFHPRGTLTFAGGSVAAPLQLEVMGRDVGTVAAGFTDNFAIGTLRLEAAVLRLVDAADNISGTEALYVDTVVVPTGSILDLNGRRVYARAVQADGAVTGGSITLLPDGGPVPLNTPTAGRLTTAAEVDEWTVFVQAGQRVVVLLNPGDAASPPPISPVLGRANVQVLSPLGAVVASGTSGPGERLILPVEAVTSAGTYRMRVSGAAGTSGNYRLTVYDAPVTSRPLTVGQQTSGVIGSPFGTDRWTFAAGANEQVQFRLLGADAPGVAFSLLGPDGAPVFSGLTGDSGPVTLAAAGQYTLEVGTGGVGAGGYAFVVEAVTQTVLSLGVPRMETLTGTGHARLFRVTVPDGNPLRITLDASGANTRTEVYARIGSPPTRRTFDAASAEVGPDHTVTVPFAAPGTWYVLVYGAAVPSPGPFTIQVDSIPLALSDLTPSQYATGQTATLTMRGAGFLPGTQVELVAANGAGYPAESVGVDSISRLTASVNLLGVPAGAYDVRVTLPTGTTRTLPAAFRVTAAGQANLETRLTLPPFLGRHATATLYVEYANTGTAAMPAPILTLQSGDPDGSDRPLLTLDQTKLVEGFWTSAIPDGFGISVQIYASGATPGVLLPGERVRVPVYYAGLQLPYDFFDDSIEFEVRVHEAGDTSLIDWAGIQAALKPAWMAADAWAAVAANLQANVGPTWGDYVRMLSNNATYLGRLGQSVTDVGELYGFEVQQALGLTPVRTLASATDAAVPAPGLSLGFGRSFGNTITERYQLGPFGRGWSASWQLTLGVEGDGTVVVRTTADSQRRFQPDSRSPGKYFSQAGDAGTLRTAASGAFELTESNGQVTRFRADGTLEYVQDTNGNRVTAGFSGGRLTSLAHSSGASLAIGYNTAGRINSITDSLGRVTTYGYDPTGAYLLSVTGPGGTTTYTYTPETTGPKAFALASVTDPGGVARFFDYDPRGRLSVTYLSGNAERVTYAYDSAGGVTATDAGGVAFGVYFDHRGLVARTEDTTGAYVRYEYDQDRYLSRETDALGRSRSYTWCGCGSLLTATDEYGRVTTFTKGGPNNQPESFTDANGNVTRYGYDDATGNLTSTVYADGSVERVAYDAVGNPYQLTNRRGQAITRSFDAAGQLKGETFPDGPPATYTYDSRQRLETATDGSGTTVFTYDLADRLTRVDYPNGRWLAYRYDLAGRRTRMEDETGFVTVYVYDAAGRLKELRDSANAVVVIYTYDPAGRLRREDKGNGTYSLYEYDVAGRVESIYHHAPDGSVNSYFEYGYDTVGRRVRQESSDGTWTYGYDLSGQLTRAVFASVNPEIPNQDLNYAYDALGNRTQTVLNGVTTAYTTNSLNQYVAAGSTTFRYDLDGNLIAESGPDGVKSYTYDSRNRLAQAATPGGTWVNDYDVFSNRQASTANGLKTDYLLDLFGLVDVVGEYSGAGARITSYSHGLGVEAMTTASGRAYYDFDIIGSAAGLGTGGGYLNTYAYSPFGDLLNAVEGLQNSFKFVGAMGITAEPYDASYMRNRFYSTSTGRFLAQDPIRLFGGSSNLYLYGDNSPASVIDPVGLWGITVGGSFGVGVVFSLGFTFGPGGVSMTSGIGLGVAASFGLGATTSSPSTMTASVSAQAGLGAFGGGAAYEYNLATRTGNFSANVDIPRAGVGGGASVSFNGEICIFGSCGAEEYGPPLPEEYGPPMPPAPPPDPPSSPGKGGSEGDSDAANSADPNEKFGALGFGPQAFVVPGVAIPYRVNFENLGPGSIPAPARPATAPAQRVEVTDQLPAALDWDTLAFTEFGYGDTVVAIPAGRQAYSDTLLLTFNGTTFDVNVDLTFDPTTGLVRVVFQSVDPTTMLPPDVLTGFLPPEDGTGRGKGHFAFTVRPKAGLPSGTAIRNVALISFDGQPVITTNQIDPQNAAAGTSPDREALNTIDAGTPTSRVNPLPAQSAATFTVSWSGQDDTGGSGVAFYDVYVSVNGGPYVLWQARTAATSATFTGIVGNTYAFFTLATDNVGFAQAPATAVPVQTVVVATAPPDPVPTAPSPVLVGSREFAVGPDAGGGALVRYFGPDGAERFTQATFDGFTGGIRTAVADFNGDGVTDLAVGTGPGTVAEVRVYDGRTRQELFRVRPFGDFTGGVFVAGGDATGDGAADLVVTPDQGGGPRVTIYRGGTFAVVANFFAIEDPNFRGGARAALGDINADGFADLVVSAGFGGGPRIAVYDGRELGLGGRAVHLMNDFFMFEETLRNGAYVAVGDVNGDGYADIIGGGGPGGGPRVYVLSGRDLLSLPPSKAGVLANFFAGNIDNRGGVRVAAKNLDGDRFADIVSSDGPGAGNRLTAYLGKEFAGGAAPAAFEIDAFAGLTTGVFVG